MLLNPRLTAEDAAAERPGHRRLCRQDAFDDGCSRSRARWPRARPRAFGVAKALINQAAGVDRLDFHLDQELQHLVRSANSDEFKEGLRAFFEKRPRAVRRDVHA